MPEELKRELIAARRDLVEVQEKYIKIIEDLNQTKSILVALLLRHYDGDIQ